MTSLECIILAAYIIQGIEILFYPLPSDTTSYALLKNQRRRSGQLRVSLKFLPLITGTLISVAAFMLPLFLILFPGLENLVHPVIPVSDISTDWAAGVLVVSGSLLTLVAVIQLFYRRRSNVKSVYRLVDTGIYGMIRSPISLGLFLIITGFFLAFPSWEMFAGMLTYILNAHVRIVMEERDLGERFGENFEDYRRRVARYFPTRGKTTLSDSELY